MTNASSSYGKADYSNWREPERIRWSFGHIHKIIAAVQVQNSPANAFPLASGSRALGDSMVRRAVLRAITTDAVVVLRDGKIMLPLYEKGNGPHTRHTLMSSRRPLSGCSRECCTRRANSI
jgi:hypothetical protein